jgi:hypothetical protein
MSPAQLDTGGGSRQYLCMAYSFLVFNFGGNEEIAQQARLKVEGWKQGFRLDKKLQLKFDRQEPATEPLEASEPTKKADQGSPKAKGKSKSKPGASPAKDAAPKSQPPSEIRVIVRLDFSDHEKLSHHRWLERIPQEEPFKTAKGQIVRAGNPDFKTTSELFDSLDRKTGVKPL